MKFDIKKYRNEFPLINNKLIYLDNASTTQKPNSVINSISNFYKKSNANVHRGTYQIAEEATFKYENSRKVISKFINAEQEEIVFTKSTTESINLVAYSLGFNFLKKNDEILITEMEHHSNIVPWQVISKKFNIILKYIPLNTRGELDTSNLSNLITKKTKLISITHMSNVLGTINPIKKIISIANKKNILTLIDAAQSISHIPLDVKKLNCDYLVFSGHKIMGPTGVGILYGKNNLLNSMEPFLTGGHMIKDVTMKNSTYNLSPLKFEAGTPNIAQAIGLGEAIKFYTQYNFNDMHNYLHKLYLYLIQTLKAIPGIELYSYNKNNGPVISFSIRKMHAYDIAKLLDTSKICVRAGHHCAQPILNKFNLDSINRISLYYYNTSEEIDLLKKSLLKIIKILS
jgi:cysteine desulfurase/selenocysteine lyase